MPFLVPDQELASEFIIAKAEAISGLKYWGDPSVFQNLEQILKSFLSDVPQTDKVREGMKVYLINLLIQRLQIENVFALHPEIEDEPVERPLIVTGYPRTGTTILQNLLSLDPLARPLLYWESVIPVPPPEPQTFKTDPRIQICAQGLANFYEQCPAYARIHHMTADGPNECENLFTFDLSTSFFNLFHAMPSYMDYLYSRDMRPAYRYYKRMLQLLNWKFPKRRWILKAPLHLPFLKDLVQVFPDAALVITHRKMEKVIASLCDLIATWRNFAGGPDNVNKGAIGQEFIGQLPIIMENYAALRAKLGDRVFYDVDYRDTVSDPVKLIRNIYDHFDYEFTDDFASLIKTYMVEHKQHEFGKHEYHLSDFGLSENMVEQAFSSYMLAFPHIFQREPAEVRY